MTHAKAAKKSSWVRSIAYDAASKVMTLKTAEATYRIDGVTPEAHQAFVNAESQGRHFHTHIKPNFDVRRVIH